MLENLFWLVILLVLNVSAFYVLILEIKEIITDIKIKIKKRKLKKMLDK